ncbi:V4R domain-containing protein [Chengkuizengella axinellae]|uniref:V4R domain-containing protein n=1 Tax=Chengkuizengella axinellae TaxID=3064388 RepID=A0ABT9IUI6_9BACL|nr:V4R domain-containing protein [Chengkuizengella sp. 2205SS18-9]MDP5273024.1 V4R domain-containing protein [Chengkuizengella sp. 2205SS18-9]
MENFSFEDMSKIKRDSLGHNVPLELFRSIRLIGMYQGLPLNGKGTTSVVGKKIGENLSVNSMDELFDVFERLKIGIPSVVKQDESGFTVAIEDCFCEGLPQLEGKYVCDLEGAIMQGALSKLYNKTVRVREVKCNINGDERCEYEIKM